MNFGEATLELLFKSLTPVGDMVTDGKISDGIDEIGDRAAAAEIVAIETAELMGAVKDAARNGVDADTIRKIVDEAKDVNAAKTLLKDPSAVVDLDGIATTADDDTPAETPPDTEG